MNVKRGRNFLLSPGPTNIPDRVLRAMQRPAIELHSQELIGLARSCLDDLKPIFRTREGETFIYAANGHGAWESALSNSLSAGDHILVFETGVFGEAWAGMGRSLGLVPEFIAGDWRHGIDAQAVEDRLRADKKHAFKAILMVQTDTATGITSDVAAVREAIDSASHPALFMVDAVASLAATDFRMDDWRVDVAVGASQKALMSPPGLSFLATSPKALEHADKATLPRHYWDWRRRLDEEPYMWFCGTAPEHLLFALREAIDMVCEEGLENIFRRHQRLADAVRAGINVWAEGGAVELNALVPKEQSNSVSAIRVDERYSAAGIRETCENRLNTSLGGGLGRLSGKAFRIGHMGDINEPMLLGALGSVELALEMCGVPHGRGSVTAAIATLAGAEGPALAAD
ncbi:MAG: aminotransferase class V-fold PLP-dependent enzyme [Gammaproteobacteria bacterium]|nr:MAG: aminotransferase class V-fold PLP-dependent enzyme [Gammaproteobacteria bacterium]